MLWLKIFKPFRKKMFARHERKTPCSPCFLSRSDLSHLAAFRIETVSRSELNHHPHSSAVSYLSITCHISVCHFRIPHSSPLMFSAALIVTFPHQKKATNPNARATKQTNALLQLTVAPHPRSLLACQVTCCYLRLYGQNWLV